ncbi:hypothetical protein RND71_011321 [Anisodus tanguticus]|uniref:Protein kinase domain-containing protein n=1 Tax=Anisodus tanguticus TaxID=243964 RepID=A0AAE1SB35_9SOLA|nr:hypothetical protein RND71_011321 [Anisodus tanguticus]
MDKSNRTMKKKSFTGGCRILKFQCMSPSDLSSEETNGDPPVAPIFSSSTTSDVATTPTTPNRGRELLRNFAFNELKLATRNFRPDCLLGVGGFGSVYKGWINENGSSPVKQGIGIPVAVKTLNKYGLQGHREWLDYNAKLSDFGLARDGPEGDKTHVSTRVVGTYGYAAPEYVMTGHLTMKSDVYGFGVVFLEILTGRRAMDNRRTRGEHNLVKWAKPYIDRHNLCQIIDPHLGGHFSRKGALRSTEIVARCLRSNAKSRPQMSEVVKMLTPLTLMREIASASNVQIKDDGFNSNDNNVLAWVLAKDKHAAGTLPSPNGSYVSSFNYTLNYKDNRNIT